MKQETDWLSSLLQTVFMGPCSDHQEHRKELFCIDFRLEFCRQCKGHSQHLLLRIFRYSDYDAILLEHIKNHLDCSEIQAYMANGAESVRLKSNPQAGKEPKLSTKPKTVHAACEACERTLMKPRNRFCSIECKLSLMDEKKASRLAAETDHLEPEDGQSGEVEGPLQELSDLCLNDSQTSEVITEAMQSIVSSSNVSEEAETSERTNFRSAERRKKTKGMSCRAPFF